MRVLDPSPGTTVAVHLSRVVSHGCSIPRPAPRRRHHRPAHAARDTPDPRPRHAVLCARPADSSAILLIWCPAWD